MEPNLLENILHSTGRGCAPGFSGTRYEHIRVLLDDEADWAIAALFFQAYANAEVPEDISACIRLGRMTALRKDKQGVRGIVAGSIIRRISTRAVAKSYATKIMEVTGQYQFALQTRAGTDALAHALQAITDMDEDAVLVSLDGIGAFDHVRRAAFFKKLHEVEGLRPLLLLVDMLYGSQSRFLWTDDAGVVHNILQGEGGEQGCPLMPALFALAIHNSLYKADMELAAGEYIMSFLDDLYVVTSRARAVEAFETVAKEVEEGTGIQSHMGKLQMWCRSGGPAPPEVEALNTPGHIVWKADLEDHLNGIVILGTPLGHPAFIQNQVEIRILQEQLLLDELCGLEDIQCAWTLLTWSAIPRSNDFSRIWRCFCDIMGASTLEDDCNARNIVTLRGRYGRIGLDQLKDLEKRLS